MSMPRTTRLLVGLLSAALLGLVPVGLASPAQAGTTETRIKATSPRKATFGDRFAVSGSVQYYDGDSWEEVPFDSGSVELQRRLKGKTAWTTLETDEYGDTFYFYPVKAVANATYRLRYSGDATHLPADATQTMKVARNIPVTVTDRLVMKGAVKPAWKRKPVIIQRKKGRRWVTYAKVRTNKRSRFSKKLYAVDRRNYFRAYVKGTTQFVPSTSDVWWTERYREVPRVSAR